MHTCIHYSVYMLPWKTYTFTPTCTFISHLPTGGWLYGAPLATRVTTLTQSVATRWLGPGPTTQLWGIVCLQ